MSDIDLAAIRERYERAYQHVADLCDPKKPSARWTMRVPAEPDRDSDLVIGAALDDIPRLLAALDAAEAELASLRDLNAEALKAAGRAEADAKALAEALYDLAYPLDPEPCWCGDDAPAQHLTICDTARERWDAHRERVGGERTS